MAQVWLNENRLSIILKRKRYLNTFNGLDTVPKHWLISWHNFIYSFLCCLFTYIILCKYKVIYHSSSPVQITQDRCPRQRLISGIFRTFTIVRSGFLYFFTRIYIFNTVVGLSNATFPKHFINSFLDVIETAEPVSTYNFIGIWSIPGVNLSSQNWLPSMERRYRPSWRLRL